MPKLMTTATEWGHSRWASLERCPREYHLSYNLGIRSLEERTAASIGIATHRGLAARYLGAKNPIAAITAGPESTVVVAEARRLYDAYNRYYGDRGDWKVPEEIIAVEHHVRARVGEATFTTRLDLVVGLPKRMVLVDHKTSSRLSGDFLAEHLASGQFAGAALAWPWRKRKEIAEEVPVVLNRLVRTNVPSFDRSEFVVTVPMQQRFARDLELLDRDRRNYEAKGYFPRHRSSCQTRYGLCQFFALCHLGGTSQAANYKIPKGVDLNEALR